jgi:hypothetical protein
MHRLTYFSASAMCKKFKPEDIWALTPIKLIVYNCLITISCPIVTINRSILQCHTLQKTHWRKRIEKELTTEFGAATWPDDQLWSLVQTPILMYIRIYGFPCILSIHPDISNFNRAHLQLSRPLQTSEVKMSWLSGIVYTPIHCRENQQYSVSDPS